MDQLVNFIIRPPRAIYCPEDDLLDQEFLLKGRWFQRKDLEVINGRGNKLQCSHYKPLVVPEGKALPCVIYCHGNSGCRADASEAAVILLPSNITVFTLDFSGSGLSEGEHVTLGWNEKDDLRAVVNYLRSDVSVSCIGLWGRSMGSVTCLMYGAEDPSIAGMVLDSPFSNLVDLMMELVDTYKYPIPKFTVKLAIQHMRRIIKKKANFDIMDLDAIQVAKCSFVPVLIGHASDDDFIHPHHSDRIYDSYVGDKNIIKFDGDHNSPRPQFYFDSLTIFFHNVLNPPKADEMYTPSMHDLLLQDNWHTVLGNQNINSGGPRQELAATSTEDTIAQLRSRRPMSRTDVPHDISFKEGQYETEEDGSSCNLGSSSSSLNATKLPNGQPHGWLAPNGRDDDYLEYTFDGYSDVPCSIEDEERMIMEAMIASLKDLEPRQPEEKCNAEDTTVSLDTKESCFEESTGPSSQEFDTKLASPGGAVSMDTRVHDQGLQETEAGIVTNDNDSQVASDKDCAAVDSSSPVQDADTTTSTRATLVVEKNSTGNFIEELAQRWRSNIFKSR